MKNFIAMIMTLLCFFSFLGCSPKKATKTTENQQDKLWALWEQNKLDEPCASLMTYQAEVNNGGHSQYFFNRANAGTLEKEVETLLSILPEPLRENLKRGYDAFAAQEDISDDHNDTLFEACDDVFYEHEQLLINMINAFAKDLT